MLCGATMEQLLPSGATLAMKGQFQVNSGQRTDDLNSAVIMFRGPLTDSIAEEMRLA